MASVIDMALLLSSGWCVNLLARLVDCWTIVPEDVGPNLWEIVSCTSPHVCWNPIRVGDNSSKSVGQCSCVSNMAFLPALSSGLYPLGVPEDSSANPSRDMKISSCTELSFICVKDYCWWGEILSCWKLLVMLVALLVQEYPIHHFIPISIPILLFGVYLIFSVNFGNLWTS